MKAWGSSDKGCVRPTNQDAFLADILTQEQIGIFMVCDGMGGAKAGHVASKYAIEGFVGEIKRSLRPDLNREQWRKILQRAVQWANQYVYDLSLQQPEFSGMGTTMVAALALPDTTLVVNVGDSRCYVLEEGAVSQITEDHSFVGQLVRQGQISRQEARNHPKKNLITRAIGVEKQIEADVFDLPAKPSQRLLLCSDGLTNMLTDEQIAQICGRFDREEEACAQLIEEAKKVGGTDNITVVLATRE